MEIAPLLDSARLVEADGLAGQAGFVAQRGAQLQLTSDKQPKADAIANRARCPCLIGHAGDGREAHPDDLAHQAQNRGTDPLRAIA